MIGDMRRAEWWLPESRRANVAGAVGFVPYVPLFLLRPAAYRDDPFYWYAGHLMVYLATYLAVYTLLTVAAFRLAAPKATRSWAASADHYSRRHRWMLSSPGSGVATAVAGIALLAVAVGQQSDLWRSTPLPAAVGVAVTLTVVVFAWASVVLTFAVDYFCQDTREAEGSLAFPGGRTPVWSDYVYFALAVSTTFGTTDVEVLTPAMRRHVTGHAIIAFVFNTVILAVAINAIG